MKGPKNVYRKNFSLIVAFLILVSVTLVISLIVAYSFTEKNVKSQFASRKDDVLKAPINTYNDFFVTRIPQMGLYNGLMDTSSARKYVDSVFHDYSFVKSVTFYQISLDNKS